MAAEKNNMDDEENVVLGEKLEQKLCSFLDENVSDDLSNVKQCLERLEKERIALEKQVDLNYSMSDDSLSHS